MLPDHFPSHLQTVCKPHPQAMSGSETTTGQNIQNGEPHDDTTTAPASAQPVQATTPAGTTLEDTICHDAVDPRTYGLNTPTKRSSTSGAWKEIKRLKGPAETDNATHICIIRLNKDKPNEKAQYCNARIKLTKGKPGSNGQASWLTTVAHAVPAPGQHAQG